MDKLGKGVCSLSNNKKRKNKKDIIENVSENKNMNLNDSSDKSNKNTINDKDIVTQTPKKSNKKYNNKKSNDVNTDPMFQDLYQTMIDKKLKAKAKREEMRKQKKKRVAMIGFVILIFALVGLYNVGYVAINEISNIVTGKNKLVYYEEFIKPAVLLDVVPFESVDKLDEKTRLQVAIWSIVMKGKTDSYKKDETGAVFIPALDIEAEVTKIFGPGQKFTHESFGDYSSQFYFDKASNSYKIPVSGRIGYIPRVTKIESDGNYKKLTVDYIPPQAWTGDTKVDGDIKPDKTLYYYIDKKDGNEFITKVELIKKEENIPEEKK